MLTTPSTEDLNPADHPILEAEVADEFCEAAGRVAKLRCYVSSEHFSVDGTLLKAWASHTSFKPKDGPRSDQPAGRNTEVGWHVEKRMSRPRTLRRGSTATATAPPPRSATRGIG
jgi:hypothetical protein